MYAVNGELHSAYGDRIAGVYDDWYAEEIDPMPTAIFLAGLAGGGPALELGIGTGRVALALLAFGVEVVGVEASQAMVDKMLSKPGGDLVDVVVGDMADVEVEGGPFPLIYLAFNTFFWLTSQAEQMRCLRNAEAQLAPGGRIVLDAYVPTPWVYVDNQRTRVLHVGVDTVRLDVSHLDPVNQVVSGNHLVLRDGSPIEMYPVTIRYAWPAEIDAMALAAGLELEARHGYYDRRPFDASSRQHVSVYRRGSASTSASA